MTSTSTRLLASSGSLFLVIAGASAKPLTLERGSGSDVAVFETIIREGYSRLARLTATGGTPLRFELRNLLTYSRGEFETIRFGDLVDLPGGASIHTSKGSRYDSDGREQGIWHVARWEDRAPYAETTDGRSGLQMQAGRALKWAAEGEPALDRVTAVTTYEVKVYLEGRERSYRACAWWIDGETQSERLRLIVNDNVVVGVGEAFEDFDELTRLQRERRAQQGESPCADDEPATTGPPGNDEAGNGPNDVVIGPISKSGQTCLSASPIANPSATINTATDGHRYGTNGKHGVSLSASFRCACNTSCGQSCDASVIGVDCIETGALLSSEACHVIARGEQRVRSAASASSSGLTCSAAGACGLKKCPLCACGAGSLTVGVSFGATGEATYTAASDVVVYAAQKDYTCGQCKVIQPPPPPPPPPSDPYEPSGPPASPLILDFGKPGFQLTSLADGVVFDIRGDGVAETVSWTNGEDAFLALDRDGDGVIGDSLELFGDRTEQTEVNEPNGFLALAVFDGGDRGGNEDGLITVADSVFFALRLWFDRNRDGVSQPDELGSLDSHAVWQIDLSPVETRRKDRWGNEFRYLSWYKSELSQRRMVQDVFFVVGSAPGG